MIKILLVSDLHLGIGAEKTPVPHTFRMVTFRRILSLAGSHDILLVAGDFFDSTHVDDDILEVVASEFDKIRKNGVKIIFMPGENEIDDNGMPAQFLSNLNITYLFKKTDITGPFSLLQNDERIFIYGASGSDISLIERKNEPGFHVGLFHADFQIHGGTEAGRAGCIKKEDLKSLKLDFYGLGHQHNFNLIKLFGKIIGAYSGSPESVSFDEKGDRYVLSITVKGSEIFQIKRLTVNSAKIKESEIDCTGLENFAAVVEHLRGKIAPGTILKAVLKGRRHFVLERDKIEEFEKEFLRLYIDDQSIPAIDALIADYRFEDTLRGDFFSRLKESIDGGAPEKLEMVMLSYILNNIIKTGLYSPEELFCRYRNV
ncbi:MAG: metallophosphoesterase [Spirochaetes bacterium]|nr:metallophosphoesterase [Spirochaetota bacterium]